MINKIKDIIHELTLDNDVYASLYFGDESKKILDYTFNFSFTINDNYAEDVKFLLDNIISKIIEKNNNVKYINYPRNTLGNYVHKGDFKYLNPFVVDEYYVFNPIANIENYIDDIQIREDLDKGRYILEWRIPILKI